MVGGKQSAGGRQPLVGNSRMFRKSTHVILAAIVVVVAIAVAIAAVVQAVEEQDNQY